MMKCLLVLLSCVAFASAWGKDGHRITAQLAQWRLSDEANTTVGYYIGRGRSLADIAPDPDAFDHSSEGRWSEPLHFVNMIKGQSEFSWSEDCKNPPSCVVGAIMNYTNIQTKEGSTGAFCESVLHLDEEPCALEFLTHFLGDVHQPLHVGYTSDLGGNRFKCSFFGKQTQLHEVWDNLIIERYCEGDWVSFARELSEELESNPANATAWANVVDPVQMANGSYNFTRFDVYVFNDPAEGDLASTNPDLGTWYYNKNLLVVREQLMKGGVRLAAIINKIFGEGSVLSNRRKARQALENK